MRTSVQAARRHALLRASSLVAIGFLAACSNDVMRFEEVLTTNTAYVAPQQQRPTAQGPVMPQPSNSAPVAAQPFPGDVDTTTTSSVVSRGTSAIAHGTNSVRQTAGRFLPSFQQNQSSVPSRLVPTNGIGSTVRVLDPQTAANVPALPNPTNLTPQNAAPLVAATKPTVQQSVPSVTRPVQTAQTGIRSRIQQLGDKVKNRISLPPRQTGPVPLVVNGGNLPAPTDNTITGAVPRTPQQPTRIAPPTANTTPATNTAPATESAPIRKGWTGAGGTWINIRQGETLYNISRRYGVPVSALRQANGMDEAAALQAGQRLMIPAYTYSPSARVSAPDHNPGTRAARASRGMQGQVTSGRVAVPKARVTPTYTPPAATTPVANKPVAAPSNRVSSARHEVTSGDTLFAISLKYGVSVAQIKAANGMSDDTVRLGQKLIIPGADASATQTATLRKPSTLPANVDKTTTGSVPATSVATPTTNRPSKGVDIASRSFESVSNPAKTNATAFRWPTDGRIITRYGEKVNGTANDGIDISVPEGTPVKAAENGTVIYSGSELADFGNLILVSHRGGWVSAYAHASANKVKRGDKVQRGQVIALSGRTGNAKVPKLHFELRKNSTPVNPLTYLTR